MVPALRKAFNAAFSPQRYENFLNDLHSHYPGIIDFRVSETPVFIPKDFAARLTDACESIIDVIFDPAFKQLTERAITAGARLPGQNDHSDCLAVGCRIYVDG